MVAGHGCLAGVSHTWQQRWLHFHMTIHYIDLHQEELKRATSTVARFGGRNGLGFVYPISTAVFTGSSNTIEDISPSPILPACRLPPGNSAYRQPSATQVGWGGSMPMMK